LAAVNPFPIARGVLVKVLALSLSCSVDVLGGIVPLCKNPRNCKLEVSQGSARSKAEVSILYYIRKKHP